MANATTLTGAGLTVNNATLTNTAQTTLVVVCGCFAAQACVLWIRASCCLEGRMRTMLHEQLSLAATSVSCIFYLTMVCGVAQVLYVSSDADSHSMRVYFPVAFAGRGVAGILLLVNCCSLARERRPPMVAIGAIWTAFMSTLLFGHLAKPYDGGRVWLLIAACILLIPLSTTLIGSMGSRLRYSQLQVIYRFLASWLLLCGACYCLAFYCCAVAGLLSTETEVLAYALLDYCLVGVSCLVVSCASGPELEAALLPAQEDELSLYPGPHTHGFFPNPNYYDDNL